MNIWAERGVYEGKFIDEIVAEVDTSAEDAITNFQVGEEEVVWV